ncbi:MAG: hypothetical protein ACR2PT_22460 [Endozoicomonas sp.]
MVLVYEKLVDEGYLLSQQRSGYFVNPRYTHQAEKLVPRAAPTTNDECVNRDKSALNWDERIAGDCSPPCRARLLTS